MNFLETAKSRYTTKNYSPNQIIDEVKIEELKDILHLSPSSINSQSWKFFFISDKDKKKELADASYWNAQKINESSHLIVFTAVDNIADFEARIERELPEGSVNYYRNFVKPKGEIAIKEWLRHQVYLSLGFFLAACASMSIDSTPMEGIQNAEYDRILQLNGYKTLFAVSIGYRSPSDVNQPSINPKSRLQREKVIKSI